MAKIAENQSEGKSRAHIFIERFQERIQVLWHRADRSDWILALIVILTALASFGLGRLSAFEEAHQPVTIEQMPLGPNQNDSTQAVQSIAASSTEAAGGQIVGNRSSKKYFYPWCSSVVKMTASNKIWFNSIADAKSAGYTPAGNCAGLQ